MWYTVRRLYGFKICIPIHDIFSKTCSNWSARKDKLVNLVTKSVAFAKLDKNPVQKQVFIMQSRQRYKSSKPLSH